MQITVQRYVVFVSTVELRPSIYPGTSLYENILWMHLEKIRTYACTFPVQRKEINVVKVHFTMRYSSRKLSNDKVITTACKFWRQIACSFQVMSGSIIFLGKKIFEIPPFFQSRPGIWAEKFTHAHYVFPPWRVGGGWYTWFTEDGYICLFTAGVGGGGFGGEQF